MVTITFPDRETEKRALAFLLGRFSGRVMRTGEHLVPEAALEALADQNIPFTVQGKATYEQQTVKNRQWMREFKARWKSRLEQIELWLVSYRIEVE